MAKTIPQIRLEAFRRQAGRCYYCGVLMWLADPTAFASAHQLSGRQVRLLQCTAEHLQARQDGGKNSRENIVAACLRCNRQRHMGWKTALQPQLYALHVRRLLVGGKWHCAGVYARRLISQTRQ